jgi:hypothetical protein
MPGFREQRWGGVAFGVVLGLTMAFYWPHEPAYAVTAASHEKFAMCTVPTQVNLSDAIFVLDSVTGRLVGGAYNTQSNTFNQTFVRNVAADFGVVDKAQYLMVSGFANLKGSSIGQPANGVLYVGELTSGKVGMYGFVYINRGGNLPVQELTPLNSFSFREGK